MDEATPNLTPNTTNQTQNLETQNDKKKVGWGVWIVSFLFFISGLMLLLGLFLGEGEVGITPSQPFFYYTIAIAIASLVASVGLTKITKWGFWLAIFLIVETLARSTFLNYPNLAIIIPNFIIMGLISIPLITNRKKFLQ